MSKISWFRPGRPSKPGIRHRAEGDGVLGDRPGSPRVRRRRPRRRPRSGRTRRPGRRSRPRRASSAEAVASTPASSPPDSSTPRSPEQPAARRPDDGHREHEPTGDHGSTPRRRRYGRNRSVTGAIAPSSPQHRDPGQGPMALPGRGPPRPRPGAQRGRHHAVGDDVGVRQRVGTTRTATCIEPQ